MPRHDKRPSATQGEAHLSRLRNGRRLGHLTLGMMHKTLRRQTAGVRSYSNELEALVMEVKGEVSVYDQHLINEAAQAEMHAAVCRWLIRQRLPTMDSSDVVTCSKEMLKARQARNKAVERLGLNKVQHEPSVIDVYDLYADDQDDDQPDDQTDPDSGPDVGQDGQDGSGPGSPSDGPQTGKETGP